MTTKKTKAKLVWLTVISVLVANSLVMLITMPLLLNYIENTYINIQLDANKNQSTILAKFLENILSKSGNEDEIISKFQEAIIGSQTESGFVCVIDSSGKFINHPNVDIIGKNVKDMKIKYKTDKYGIIENWFKILSQNISSGGVINFESEDAEIVYSVSLMNKPWRINSHENTKKIKSEILIIRNKIIIAAVFITILMALLASYLVRKVSLRYEKAIENVNYQLQNNNNELNLLNSKLENLNNEKNNILHIVAHDLKNPIAGILLNIELLITYLHKMSTEDLISKLNQLTKTTQFMKDIVMKLLDNELIENAKITINKTAFKPSVIVGDSLKQFESQCKKKNINTIFNNNFEEVEINSDKHLFREIIDNYISNSIKYSPFDKNIFIQLEKIENYLIFNVKDEGPGISKEEQNKLFLKFSKLSSKTTDGEDSSGIGLYSVKKNAEALGGEVYCNSEYGQGAEFVFKLPIK